MCQKERLFAQPTSRLEVALVSMFYAQRIQLTANYSHKTPSTVSLPSRTPRISGYKICLKASLALHREWRINCVKDMVPWQSPCRYRDPDLRAGSCLHEQNEATLSYLQ